MAYLHAWGTTEAANEKSQEVFVSFGPDHAPLEQRQVERVIEETRNFIPPPSLIVFAACQFDPEAAKDIEAFKWQGVTLLRTWMNADLLTNDLKAKRASNESFWLIGQPDVELERLSGTLDKAKFKVKVRGFDYYDTVSGEVQSGDAKKIAIWMLDPNYDGRSLFPRQVFFPMASPSDINAGWNRLARTLRAEIDQDLVQHYHGTVSLPFDAGEHRRAAVKIVDDRGVESLKILDLT